MKSFGQVLESADALQLVSPRRQAADSKASLIALLESNSSLIVDFAELKHVSRDCLVQGQETIDKLMELVRVGRYGDGQFIHVFRAGAFAVMRLELPTEFGGGVVIVGGARGLMEQFPPVRIPLQVHGEEIHQVARKCGGGQPRLFPSGFEDRCPD